MALSWKPVRRGAIYCAPACGSGCTWAAYSKAVQESTALAKCLGSGWKPLVNENMEWWWSVKNKYRRLRIYPIGPRNKPDGFHCILAGQYTGSGKTAKAAIQAAIAEAVPEVPGLKALIKTVEGSAQLFT
jgi:hypothetical protein